MAHWHMDFCSVRYRVSYWQTCSMKPKVGDLIRRTDGDNRRWLLLQETKLSNIPSKSVWRTLYTTGDKEFIEVMAFFDRHISSDEFIVIPVNTDT
jgi:hypothetical protein